MRRWMGSKRHCGKSRVSLSIPILAIALLTIAPAIAAPDEREDFRQSYEINPGGLIRVENTNGYIRIFGWDRSNVQVDVVKRTDRSREELDRVRIVVDSTPNNIRIRTVHERTTNIRVKVDYDIKIPRSVNVELARSTNGDVAISDVNGNASGRSTNGSVTVTKIAGSIEAVTTSGRVSVSDIKGDASLQSANGDVEAIRTERRLDARLTNGSLKIVEPKGDVSASSTNGSILIEAPSGRVVAVSINGDVKVFGGAGRVEVRSISSDVVVEGARGSVRASTVSGTIRLNNIDGADVDVNTVSGDVIFRGSLQRNGSYIFGSHSGDVTLTLPANSSFTISLSTFSGDIDTAFPLTITPGPQGNMGRRLGRRIEATHGDGGARIEVKSFSGTITLRKY